MAAQGGGPRNRVGVVQIA